MEKIEIVDKLYNVFGQQVTVMDMLITINQMLIEENEKDPKESNLKLIKRINTFAESAQNLSKAIMGFTGELIDSTCKS